MKKLALKVYKCKNLSMRFSNEKTNRAYSDLVKTAHGDYRLVERALHEVSDEARKSNQKKVEVQTIKQKIEALLVSGQ